MSDLSRLLGDVYGGGDQPADDQGTDGAAEQPATLAGALPEWAGEEVLDEAFANWVPGPPEGAPTAEHEVVAPVPVTVPVQDTHLQDPAESDWLFGTDTVVAAYDELPTEADLPIAPPIPVRWTPADDDILPQRRKVKLGRRR